MSDSFRHYDHEMDAAACRRIWRECGWIEDGQDACFDNYVLAGDAWVAELAGEAECLVSAASGNMAYQAERLSFSGITGVTTSRIARQGGLATRLLASAIAEVAESGVAVAGLGMFDQGYYDRFGFGTCGYQNRVRVDPVLLSIPIKLKRRPVRIGIDDFERIHRNRLSHVRCHGGCVLDDPRITKSEMYNSGSTGFGLGFEGPDGELTHHFWAQAADVESGPYAVWWMCYQNRHQLLELLKLMADLGDQVCSFNIPEPPGVQLQDLIRKPLRMSRITKGGQHPNNISAVAWCQMRLLDLEAGVAATHLQREVAFNLVLKDPIEAYLDSTGWSGLSGRYVVQLGPESNCVAGEKDGLETLEASVGAFTRLWLGVLPATGLQLTDRLDGPETLLWALDEAIRLPRPHPDWPF